METGLSEMDVKGSGGKSLQEYFSDWENSAFGFGYGTGERYTIPAIRLFMETLDEEESYDYRDLEFILGPLPAWLLINALARHPTESIEYGSSPRHGWLTKGGRVLRQFMLSHTDEQLYEFSCTETDVICYPNACNCCPAGYEEGRECPNPFWGR